MQHWQAAGRQGSRNNSKSVASRYLLFPHEIRNERRDSIAYTRISHARPLTYCGPLGAVVLVMNGFGPYVAQRTLESLSKLHV